MNRYRVAVRVELDVEAENQKLAKAEGENRVRLFVPRRYERLDPNLCYDHRPTFRAIGTPRKVSDDG